MGNPKQKWTSEEEEALRAGVAKHGTGKWKNILRDPEFAPSLTQRSNIDLKVPIALSFSSIGYFFNFDCASIVFSLFSGVYFDTRIVYNLKDVFANECVVCL